MKIEPTNNDNETAIAVVNKYRPTVLPAMLPKLFKLVNDAMPETKEKNTNGTTSIFNRFIKISLPRLKTISSKKTLEVVTNVKGA